MGEDAAQRYTQKYFYDAVGNILELRHSAGVGTYKRIYGYGTSNNRLVTTQVGNGPVYTYGHDARGNMVQMPHLRAGWGMANQMTDAQVADVTTFYQYSSGERVRKYTDKGSVKEERIYLGSYELYRRYDGSGNIDLERSTVHVSDGSGRIAMLETRTGGDDEGAEQLTRYIYSNHLQSATLELDESGQIISYEEYHPYGTTAFQAMNADLKATAKRYRFAGKERDEESGLYYHGARYYAPWLGRWTAADPINNDWYNAEKGYGVNKNKERDFLELTASSYEYCYDNPINYTDPTGEQSRVVKPRIAVPPELLRGASKSAPNGGRLGTRADLPRPSGPGELIPLAVVNGLWGGDAVRVGNATIVNEYTPNGMITRVIQPAAKQPIGKPISAEGLRVGLQNMRASQNWKPTSSPQNSAPLQKITTNPANLTDQDKADIAHRIATGKQTGQDMIYAGMFPEITTGTGAGFKRDKEYGHLWDKASLSEVLAKFAPNAVPELSDSGQKVNYNDPITKFEVSYDKEGNYLRIKNPQGHLADLQGKQVNAPSNLKTKKDIGAYIQLHTHFKNTDK